jgi:hypothetical protein
LINPSINNPISKKHPETPLTLDFAPTLIYEILSATAIKNYLTSTLTE